MDSEDSRDGNKSSSSSSSSSRSNSSASSVKHPHSPSSPPLSKSQTSRSQSPDSRSQSSRSPSLKNIQSPDNLSDAHSNINSPDNLDGGPKTPTLGPKTPESPSSPMSVDRSKPSTPPSPASPPSPAAPATPTTPPPVSPEAESRDSPSNGEEWKGRSRTRSSGDRDKSSSRDRSRSDSSRSSRNSTYNKRGSLKDPTTEAISDGEMESDQEETKPDMNNKGKLDMSHEDLSDVSDLDSMCTEDIEKDTKSQLSSSPKQEIKTNGISSPKQESDKNLDIKKPQENTEDVEDQLDFEAEEGECIEPKKAEINGVTTANIENPAVESVAPGRRSRGSSLEEGEVSDEGERRPEENEPRPVCRFYSRGACTWGVSCRFLHPGVTDKGNYSMFEVVRGVAHPTTFPPRDGPTATTPIAPESAWERGLRTAKEMVRIANKRKEQDMDFEEKKLHLSVGGVVHDPDAELAYAAAAVGASPPTEHGHHPHHDAAHRDIDPFRGYGPMYRPQPRFPGGRPVLDERERFFERERMYERGERAFERIPPHYDDRVPPIDEAAYHKSRRVRSSREVIVQRVEGRAREGRGDEWADPWMRASPATRRRKRASSDDSYSSTSSHSSRSPRRKRRASSSSKQRVSPAAIVRERRLATARAAAMNPPAPRRRAPSPAAARQHAANPPPPVQRYKEEADPYGRRKPNRDRKRYSSTSGSESSSSSSESESESRSSSSSGSSSGVARRGRNARLLNAAARPRLNAKSSAELAAAVSTAPSKKDTIVDLGESTRKKVASSPPNDNKSVSRREELLKQLKAVEDAIARKRSTKT